MTPSPPLPFTRPLDISFLLHCYISSEPWDNWCEPIEECERRHLSLGIIETIPGCVRRYRPTPLGSALVECLLRTPLPRLVFVDAAGNIVD